MFIKDTSELEKHVTSMHEKMAPLAKKLEVYKPLDVVFSTFDKLPPNFDGYFGQYFSYSDEFGYHYAFMERGRVRKNNTTSSLFEITYWILKSVASAMASKYESRNRKPKTDFRRLLFETELKLLNEVGENYRKRAEIEIDEILKENPYDDSLYS
ncbi:MAG: immunity 63 family protein [Oscillospiraceae bacterium]|nr:immunity 63 family protein [Oscillospiraceae bacterium]